MKKMASYILGNLTKKEHEKSKSGLEKITIKDPLTIEERITVDGPLTIENSAEIVERVHKSLINGKLVLDLARLEDYDTSCAGLLLGAVREAENSNHELRIVYNPKIKRSTENLFHIKNRIAPYVVEQGATQQPINTETYHQ